MDATAMDLRYRMKRIVQALDRRERVNLLYRGKIKGVIMPATDAPRIDVSRHPFFGSDSGNRKSVVKTMAEVRRSRHRDL